MRLHSFGTLEPCGVGVFRGVEFVCCPQAVEEAAAAKRKEAQARDEYAADELDDDEEDEADDDDDAAADDDDDEGQWDCRLEYACNPKFCRREQSRRGKRWSESWCRRRRR